MEPFTSAEGRAAVLMQPNIDTDVIIRIERLAECRLQPDSRSLLGRWAFEALRYGPDGEKRDDCPLNDPALRNAPILVAGANFGCGSSREGAVWALMGMGFRCVIAESFGDIFYANCFQNGFLPVVLPAGAVARLAEAAQAGEPLGVDLQAGTVRAPSVVETPFTLDESRRQSLLLGLDEIGQTLQQNAAISDWQARDRVGRPWIWQEG